jgi:hypothetical protein
MSLFDDAIEFAVRYEYEYEDAGITFGKLIKEELDKYDLILDNDEMEIPVEGIEGELMP